MNPISVAKPPPLPSSPYGTNLAPSPPTQAPYSHYFPSPFHPVWRQCPARKRQVLPAHVFIPSIQPACQHAPHNMHHSHPHPKDTHLYLYISFPGLILTPPLLASPSHPTLTHHNSYLKTRLNTYHWQCVTPINAFCTYSSHLNIFLHTPAGAADNGLTRISCWRGSIEITWCDSVEMPSIPIHCKRMGGWFVLKSIAHRSRYPIELCLPIDVGRKLMKTCTELPLHLRDAANEVTQIVHVYM